MTPSPQDLVARALDDDLSEDEFLEFQDWLRADNRHLNQFVRAALLHHRIRVELLALSAVDSANLPVVSATPAQSKPPVLRRKATWGIVAAAAVLFAAAWLRLAETPVSAAAELNRLIAVQKAGTDRTYRIDVEELVSARGPRNPPAGRPPKPPLDGATLHVRHGNQFVLIRNSLQGQPFITGSNGSTSWAVSSQRSVRFSFDLSRFNRDLPGHELDIPLINVEEGLSHLWTAYDIKLSPGESADQPAANTRLLVGVKKRGARGPQRVEIAYLVDNGEIRQLRMVEMPYGPERLTILMTLVEERDLGPRFFDHESHHPADVPVIEE